jgi:hypothetical protein
MTMFYISACVAIVGAVGYQYFVKRVPASLNPPLNPTFTSSNRTSCLRPFR